MMDSAFTSRLHTNYHPTDDECIQIREIVDHASTILSELDAEFAILQQKRLALKFHINDHLAFLSPMRRLSMELLQSIFMYTLPTRRNAVMSATESPLLLAQVCSYWRQVAISTPQLWSTLHIPIVQPLSVSLVASGRPRHEGWSSNLQIDPAYIKVRQGLYEQYLAKCDSVLQGRRQLAELWLQRAGNTDLSLSLMEVVPFPPTSCGSVQQSRLAAPAASQQIIHLLLSFASQWAELDLSTHRDLAMPLLLVSPDRTPKLRSLRLQNPSYFASAASPRSYNLLGAANITSFQLLLNQFDPNDLGLVHIAWHNLTDLSIAVGWNSAHTAQFLASCPNLVALSLHTGRELSIGLGNPPIVPHQLGQSPLSSPMTMTLPHLKKLQWYCNSDTTHLDLFSRDMLHLPALEHLHFCPGTSRGFGYESLFTKFLTQYGHGIKKLQVFRHAFGTLEVLKACLKLTPEVETFVLSSLTATASPASLAGRSRPGLIPDHSFWEALSAPSGSGKANLLPKLTTMTCHAYTSPSFASSSLSHFIRSRRQVIPALKHLCVYFDGNDVSSAPSPAQSATQTQFMAELSALPGIDLEGLKLDIRWPQVASTTNEAAYSPFYGLTPAVPIMQQEGSHNPWSVPE